ncbi:MAG TPA: ATP-binding cassette domain-containing protein, partial [Coxiellaceae bacterium]|nr:ATP-binding cassette domain-containing protein [Coxiellaceae bacterium]
MNIIEFNQVTKTYRFGEQTITALEDINLRVKAGEIYGIIGKSGAGKSTLIRCVNLLERPTSGEVWVNDQNLLSLNPSALRQARHQMGMVFQQFNLLSTKTVYENVALPLRLMHFSENEIKKKVNSLLRVVGLSDKAQVYPNQLSGGQKQRVAIARALTTNAKILLCDEMTSALDPETTNSILNLVKTINQEFKVTVLLITHEMNVIKQIADRVAVLDKGCLVEEAEIVQLFSRPKSQLTKNLLDSAFKLELPDSLRTELSETPKTGLHPILRIEFVGETAAEPIIDELVREFKVHVNILQANLEYLRHVM